MQTLKVSCVKSNITDASDVLYDWTIGCDFTVAPSMVDEMVAILRYHRPAPYHLISIADVARLVIHDYTHLEVRNPLGPAHPPILIDLTEDVEDIINDKRVSFSAPILLTLGKTTAPMSEPTLAPKASFSSSPSSPSPSSSTATEKTQALHHDPSLWRFTRPLGEWCSPPASTQRRIGRSERLSAAHTGVGLTYRAKPSKTSRTPSKGRSAAPAAPTVWLD